MAYTIQERGVFMNMIPFLKKRCVNRRVAGIVLVMTAALILAGQLSAQGKQDRYSRVAPNSISFSEIRGYENWAVVAPSYRTDQSEVRIILGNETILKAYREGVPGNGKPFPDGSILVKVGWAERKHPSFPAALEPDALQRVEFMIKDAKKFKKTQGWGYARFVYDVKTDSFAPYGKDAAFDQECSMCHTLVKDRDYVFTSYGRR